ncbi:putative bifunctional diguanylate cyclase/phosphodiesterase [Aquabacterium sp. OR-4]|uniref:putative bifunctional diguanylate cyclase/phosphodiesterase n=1 Tax=Aquabacterium sp. OR-4 TaxID=2978127 RepID=UPI0028C8E2E6|nr:bifunctional diguanylate cyclase/phosphodiesterase [Aquabacterium sp. OR-4]MDT7837857.1 bifunctional diguanylate cyclase/phosphodiesterase [Aquabacterium sp. OR-4]
MRHQVLGRTPFEYQPGFERSIFFTCIDTCRRERKPASRIGYSTILKRWLMVRVFPCEGGTMMLANDASESVVRQHQLAQRATQDELTGLPNKLQLVEVLGSRSAADAPLSLAVIGLDRFRQVIDARGYAGGDMAILEMASRLQSATLPDEQLFRLTGHEFALLLPEGPGVDERLATLAARCAMPVVLEGTMFVLGATVGLARAEAVSSDGADSAEQRIKHAALALRHAKKVRRGGVLAYEPALEAATQQRAGLETELRAAIEQQQFTLVLQPKGRLDSGHVVGAEALIRWQHPERGMISPAEFLPLADECGLMLRIDQLVLEMAVQQVAALRALDLAMPVSINLSVDSLADPTLALRVQTALASAGLPPVLLEVEVPEGAVMKDVDTSAQVLSSLGAMGVAISIDDFGTGYSSFAYLARFPVHALKIDRSFVADMQRNGASLKIVRAMVRLAHSLQMQVVAEGAETDTEIELLRRMRCDLVQGYGYGRPMPLDRFIDFARSHRPQSLEPAMPDPMVV